MTNYYMYFKEDSSPHQNNKNIHFDTKMPNPIYSITMAQLKLVLIAAKQIMQQHELTVFVDNSCGLSSERIGKEWGKTGKEISVNLGRISGV